MAIILEGPDGAGKSTLANALAQLTGMTVVHGGGPAKNAQESIARANNEVTQWLSPNLILDRSHIISDFLYGSTLKREVHFDIRMYMRLLQYYQNTMGSVILIFCDVSDRQRDKGPSQIIRIGESLDHNNAVDKNYVQLVNQYRIFRNSCSLFMDTTVFKPREDLRAALKFFTDKNVTEAQLKEFINAKI